MTPTEYNAKGLNVSLHIEQAQIDRAERDVRDAYIKPILPNTQTPEPEAVADAVANLSFLLLLQRNIVETRSGAKIKTNANSQNAGAWDAIGEQAQTCAMKIDALRQLSGANKTAKVTDICKIYFKTNFLYQ